RVVQLGARRERVAAPFRVDQAIEAVEEVRLVLLDRPAERVAAVLLLGMRLVQVALGDEEVALGHLVVGIAAEQRSVEDVAALLRDRVDDRTGGASELGVVLVGQHLELLHRFQRGTHLAAARAAEIVVVVAAAVDREVAAAVAAAADNQRLARKRRRRRRHLDARRQADREHPVLVHDRQRRDLRWPMLAPICFEVMSTSGEVPETVTLSSMPPTASLMSSVAVLPIVSTMSGCSYFLNPLRSAVIL